MGSSKLLGTAPDQVPTNADLGSMAFQDANAVKITGGDVIANHYVDTAISDVKPSLLLDFANGKTLDPRVTFTRSTTATYYDGKTTAMAEQNLLTYSQDLEISPWGRQNVNVYPNCGTAPDGSITADLIAPVSGTVTYPCVYRGGYGAGTVSFYAKANGKSYVHLLNGSGNASILWFNVANGSIGSNLQPLTATITSVGNGWYRCSAYYPSTFSFVQLNIADADGQSTTTGDGTSGVYIWGVQVESRSGASAYVPTTANPVTNYIPALQTAGGGAPRFDHDPITGESKGLLIEEQRTNLATYSQTFTTGWNVLNVVAYDNYTVAPDGTLTASKLVTSVASGNHVLYKGGVPTGTPATISIYAKAAELTRIWLGAYEAFIGSEFNLANGTVVQNVGTGLLSSSITPIGNGWYKCAVTVNSGYGQLTYGLIQNGTNLYTQTVAGQGLYIWGAQLEAGAFPTSYIPTTSAQVTRSPDIASMAGANYQSVFTGDQGSLYSEFYSLNTGSGVYPNVCGLSDGTGANNFAIMREGGVLLTIDANSSRQVTFSTSTVNQTYNKAAMAYQVGNYGAAVNGNGFATVTSGTTNASTWNLFKIGSHPNSGYYLNGCLKKIAYYPKRLSNAELQEMTS